MKPVRILQLTDLHVLEDSEARLKGIPTRELLQDVIRKIQDSAEVVDHLVITGDHTHDELPTSYSAVRSILSPWLDRLWQVPGNHDDRTVMRSVFGDRISGAGQQRINFSFKAGSWLCLGLDTHLPGSVSGLIEDQQIEWIVEQLHNSPDSRVALFMHHPPVLLNSVWMDRIGLDGRERLQKCIEQNPAIQLVCCGHVHHESSHRVGGAEIVTTPSTGIQFSPDGESATFVAAPPGYRVIELTEHGYRTEVRRLSETRYVPVP